MGLGRAKLLLSRAEDGTQRRKEAKDWGADVVCNAMIDLACSTATQVEYALQAKPCMERYPGCAARAWAD